MPMEFSELIGRISDDKFTEMYGSLSRKIRNMLEGAYGKRNKKKGRVSLKSLKNKSDQAVTIKAALAESGEEQTIEEILKTWLFTKREMLGAALDFFEIENDMGITDSELTPIEEAEPEKLEALFAHLEQKTFPKADIAIYLAFLQVQNFEKVPTLTDSLSD